jgi:hypothetical protein
MQFKLNFDNAPKNGDKEGEKTTIDKKDNSKGLTKEELDKLYNDREPNEDGEFPPYWQR